MLFLKIPISFTSLRSCLIPPREEREMTERTTAQLPANKKCCLLIFAIAIGCLVLAAIPASSLLVLWYIRYCRSPSSWLSCSGSPRNARGVLGCTLRLRPRVNPRLSLFIAPNIIRVSPASKLKMAIFSPFSCISPKNSVSLQHNTKKVFVNIYYLCTAKQESTCLRTKTQ